MIPFLLCALASSPQTPDLVLSRGIQLTGPFAGLNQQYWDVSEGEMDARGADLSIPTIFALTGNTQRKILIRFGSLDLATSRNSKIVDATLVLTLAESDKSLLHSVKILKRPWVTPGVSILQVRAQGAPPSTPKKPDAPKAVPFAAGVTWNRAGGDVSPWQSPGANGRDDSSSVDEKITVANGEIRISNLGPALQYWKTHEGENFGFLLEFDGETGIWSSTSPEARPRLELKLEKTDVKDPRVTYAHDGDGVSVKSAEPIKSVEVYRGTTKVSTELMPKVSLAPTNNSKDPRGGLVRVVTNFSDPNVPQEVMTFDPAAPWVKLTPASARTWNQGWVDQSFYSFAKYGAMKYVNGEGDKDEMFLPEVHALASGSHMMETMFMGRQALPLRPTRNPLARQMVKVEGGPLSLAQVDHLMNGKIQFPVVIVAKVVNIDNRPLEDVSISVKTSVSDTHDIKSDQFGLITLPRFTPGTVGDVVFTATSNGVTQTFTTPVTTFSDLYARGNDKAAVIDLPFNLPTYPITNDTNLAAGKPVSDSAKSFPAQLVGLVDDSLDTAYTLPAKGWVEVDLGRDRLLGELVLQGEVPKQFKVKVYGTTDKLDQADWWIDEIDSDNFRKSYETGAELVYRPAPNTARYIRIENLTDKPAKMKGLKVFAARKS